MERTDREVGNLRLFVITGNWNTAAQEFVAPYDIVCEENCRFLAVSVRENEKAPKTRQKMREAQKAYIFVVAFRAI